MTDRTGLPVACTLSEPELAKRRAGLFADLARRRQEVRWLADGVTPRHSPEEGTLALLGEFIQLETQCCQFLRFQLTIEPAGGPISRASGSVTHSPDSPSSSGAPDSGGPRSTGCAGAAHGATRPVSVEPVHE